MNQATTYTLDNVPFNRFHFKLAAYTLGGSFIDGYILGIIEFALVLLVPALNINSLWQGLIGSSPLIGVFIGALFFGRLADAFGRKQLYTLDFIIIIVTSILQFFVTGPVSLFILRVILGTAIGAEYAIGPSLQSEFMPVKYRAPLLSFLNISWTVGYFASAIVGYVLSIGSPDNWRWMLVSSAVPAIIVFLLRIGAPESPRWLISRGRVEEAREVVRKHVGENITIDNLLHESTHTSTDLGYRHLFSKNLWKRTLFCCIFWSASVLAFFPIFTFAPTILSALNIKNELMVTIFLNIFNLFGAIVAFFIIDRMPRKVLLNGTYAIAAIPLLILAIVPNAPSSVLIACFCGFIFVFTIGAALQFVYPAELFPTEIRASGTGFCSAMSRIASALGTFLLPMAMTKYGTSAVLLFMVGVIILSIITSAFWAPETRNQSLDDAADNIMID
jgi:putative benzoate transport protein (MFS family)